MVVLLFSVHTPSSVSTFCASSMDCTLAGIFFSSSFVNVDLVSLGDDVFCGFGAVAAGFLSVPPVAGSPFVFIGLELASFFLVRIIVDYRNLWRVFGWVLYEKVCGIKDYYLFAGLLSVGKTPEDGCTEQGALPRSCSSSSTSNRRRNEFPKLVSLADCFLTSGARVEAAC